MRKILNARNNWLGVREWLAEELENKVLPEMRARLDEFTSTSCYGYMALQGDASEVRKIMVSLRDPNPHHWFVYHEKAALRFLKQVYGDDVKFKLIGEWWCRTMKDDRTQPSIETLYYRSEQARLRQ